MLMIESLEAIALEAGHAAQAIYRRGKVDVQVKADASPVTEADLLANSIICNSLRRFSTLPIISEEDAEVEPMTSPVDAYWLIDPIDGTKEFIARRPTFTVNIALIEHGVPIAGVVYAPDRDELYAGADGIFRFQQQEFKPQWAAEKIGVCSLSHAEPQFARFEQMNDLHAVVRIGSSIKFCLVAKGAAHFYPRYRALSSWDIAAGHAVARAAGCQMLDLQTGKELRYEFHRRMSQPFILQAPGLSALV